MNRNRQESNGNSLVIVLQHLVDLEEDRNRHPQPCVVWIGILNGLLDDGTIQQVA
jgi:hypothetical protein